MRRGVLLALSGLVLALAWAILVGDSPAPEGTHPDEQVTEDSVNFGNEATPTTADSN